MCVWEWGSQETGNRETSWVLSQAPAGLLASEKKCWCATGHSASSCLPSIWSMCLGSHVSNSYSQSFSFFLLCLSFALSLTFPPSLSLSCTFSFCSVWLSISFALSLQPPQTLFNMHCFLFFALFSLFSFLSFSFSVLPSEINMQHPDYCVLSASVGPYTCMLGFCPFMSAFERSGRCWRSSRKAPGPSLCRLLPVPWLWTQGCDAGRWDSARCSGPVRQSPGPCWDEELLSTLRSFCHKKMTTLILNIRSVYHLNKFFFSTDFFKLRHY